VSIHILFYLHHNIIYYQMSTKFINCVNIPQHFKELIQDIQQKLQGLKYCFIGSIAMAIYSCLCNLKELPIAPKNELNIIYKDIYKGEITFEQRFNAHDYTRSIGDIDILIDFKDFNLFVSILRSIGFKFGKSGNTDPPPIIKGIELKTSISMTRNGITIDLVNQKTLFKKIFDMSDAIFNFELPVLNPTYLQKNKIKTFKDRYELKDLYDIWFYEYIRNCTLNLIPNAPQ